MIVNLRGTSGSGKTYVTMKTIELMNGKPFVDEWTGEVLGYELDYGVTVIGLYPGGCGGCDRIKTVGEVEHRVKTAAKHGHVLFEGLILSTIYGRFAALAKEFPFVWAFLDTSKEQSLANLTARNNGKPFNRDNIEGKWELAKRHRTQAINDGFTVLDIPMATGEYVLRDLFYNATP